MGHKVLLADDSITVQKIVKLTLADEGIEVIAVGNGELALQQLADIRPDLIMADVFMPGHDGYEVCEYVKSSPEYHHIPVILLVHAFEPFDQARASQVRADRHLTKPFHSIRTLVATVRELIENYTAAYSPGVDETAQAAAASQNQELPASVVTVAAAVTEPAEMTSEATSAESVSNTTTAETGNEVSEDFHSSSQPLSFDTAKLRPVDVAFGEVVPFRSFSTSESAEPVNISTASAVEAFDVASATPLPAEHKSASTASVGNAAAPPSADDMQLLSFSPASLLTLNSNDLNAEPETLSLFSDAAPGTEVSATSAYASSAVDEVLDLDSPDPEIVSAALPATLAQASVSEMDVLDEAGSSYLPIPSQTEIAAPAYNFSSDASAFTQTNQNADAVMEQASESSATESSPFFSMPVSSVSSATTSESFSARASHTPVSEIAEFPATDVASDEVQEIAEASVPAFGFAQSADFGVGQVIEPVQPVEAVENFAAPETETLAEHVVSHDSQDSADEITTSAAESVASIAAHSALASEPVMEQGTDRNGTQNIVQDVAPGVIGNPHDTTLNAQAIPEAVIDEIVKRVVAQMSEKVVQEVAWEVVPDLAELLIRRQLAQKANN